ncbi:hypothetical protein GYMLUDRAFT_491039 [Collybiopsis luxurians FD-317 M1]|uniref:Uncharacterized protein n=1 Tax=Collybiopsis luxurians FD-317 M1 TaxID=944289 RepID=A0A0D0C3Q9_9AGAR|nr:hypothetical protein GYMLUDRAFT_491039 [Collybiopsis luxurians FD-317 M1]
MTLNSLEEHEHAVTLLYHSGHIIAIIPQTFVYGIYAVLVSICSYTISQRLDVKDLQREHGKSCLA